MKRNQQNNAARRQFLIKGSAALGALSISPLLAQGMMGMNHGDMNMGSMDHSMMSGMDHGMMGSDMSIPPMVREGYQLGANKLTARDIEVMKNANKNLMPVEAISSGNVLPDLPLLKNESAVQGVFKGTLRVQKAKVSLAPGTTTEFWGYNGMLPGPQIVVYEGDKVSIEVINELDEETTVHWHGLLVPASEDGNPQDPIKPGGRRTYQFDIPKDTAGTYWYHPHAHGSVAKQVFMGLAGTFIVRKRDDIFADLPERHLLISDLKLHADGKIAENSFFDWMNGREGQFTLINGALNPIINIDQPTRFRIWSAGSSRYLNLDFSFADSYLIATDGGYLEAPQKLDAILLSPGERIEVIVIPSRTGQIKFNNLSYNRQKMGPVSVTPTYSMATIEMTKSPQDFQMPTAITNLPGYAPATKSHYIEYTEVMNPNQLLFLVNGKMHDPNRIDDVVEKDAVEEWIVFNNSHMDHNFHIHGTQFYVIEREMSGIVNQSKFKAFKDTINLKPYERVKLVMKQDFTGLRMYHCHILEHETLGMMGQLETK